MLHRVAGLTLGGNLIDLMQSPLGGVVDRVPMHPIRAPRLGGVVFRIFVDVLPRVDVHGEPKILDKIRSLRRQLRHRLVCRMQQPIGIPMGSPQLQSRSVSLF